MADTLLKDLVDIPKSVQQSDFVVKLSSGIQQPDKIVGSYVVTDDIAHCFDQALDLIGSALRDDSSKGAYLHGSFGSGKSHFMAVLHLLLQGNAQARSLPKLAPVIAKHDPALEDQNILLVPYHMVGKESMEAGVLGGYVEHVRKLHPDAPMPAVYASEKIFEDARKLRETLGDEKFFEGLGGVSDELAGFGDLAGEWDAASFETAMQAPADDEDRRRLTADLISTYFKGYADLAEGAGGGFVPFDDGLAAITAHAKQLKYDGVLLFLDELILWLASRMGDPDFVSREGQKVALLVEGSAPRAVPIVSLIARQRDLKDFIGEGVAGAEKQSFAHGLEWWSGRFDTITLADTNLPAIVEERLLKPTSDSARAQLDRAFDDFTNRADRALDTLMTDEADKNAFRRSYPFSPALIKVLVGVSAFLQRERTSLKLLSQLLVDRRDDLTVGQIVPLGDLWDVVDGAEEPMDGALKRHFTKARQLYHNKLRPLVLDMHNVTEDEAGDLPASHQLHADDRLAKTLLLAALVPDVEAVRGMTVGRLTDLNHGSIRAPIPGMERQRVHSTLQAWGGRIGELRLDGDETDPSVSLKLVGVDVRSIMDKAAVADTQGKRIQLVRDLVGEAIGVDVTSSFIPSVSHVWRGRKREVDLVFGNVRDPSEVPDSEFRSTPERPRVIIDHPFDTEGFNPADDMARIDALRQSIGPQPTLCWIPLSLTDRAKDDLGKLVILDHLLTGDRLDQYTGDLPAAQRVEAREVLRAQQQQLRSSVVALLRQAYGAASVDEQLVRRDLKLEDQFTAVDPAIDVRPPKEPSLRDAFQGLLDQLWSQIAPAHPEFPEEVRKRELERTLELVAEAAARPDRRLEVAPGDRKLLSKVIAPLELGTIGEAHFVLGREWRDRFAQAWAKAGKPPRTVENLRTWTDQPTKRLLDDQVLALVVSAYAIEDDLAIELDGATLEPTVDKLQKRAELQSVDLPAQDDWAAAKSFSEAVFGVTGSPVLSASNASLFCQRIREAATERREDSKALVTQLKAIADRFDVDTEADRIRTANAAARLLADVDNAGSDVALVELLAQFDAPTSNQALGRSMSSASTLVSRLRAANLQLLDGAFGHEKGAAIRNEFVAALRDDEFATPLASALQRATDDATKLLVGPATPPKPVPPSVGPKPKSMTGTPEQAIEKLQALDDDGIREVTISWEEA